MEQNTGWIKLHRSLDNHRIMRDPLSLWLWTKLLLLANFRPREWIYRGHPYVLERGQVLVSINDLNSSIDLDDRPSRKAVENRMRRMEDTGMIRRTRSNRGTIVTICNYSLYQDIDIEEGNAKDTPRERQGNAKGTPREPPKELKKERTKEEYVEDGGIQGGAPSPSAPTPPPPPSLENLKLENPKPEIPKREVMKFVFVSEAAEKKLLAKMSKDELTYWYEEISRYACQNPKAFQKKYCDHPRLVLSWRRMRLESGKVWEPLEKLYKYPSKFAQSELKPRPFVYSNFNSVLDEDKKHEN